VKNLLQPKVILVIAAVIAIALLAHFFHLGKVFSALLDDIRGLGPLAPLLFIIIYILGAILFVPGSILTIGGGVLFDGAFEERGVNEGLREVAAELALGDVELF